MEKLIDILMAIIMVLLILMLSVCLCGLTVALIRTIGV